MEQPIITLKNVSKSFAATGGRAAFALERIDLEIRAGEIFILVGPSGCGKSTLLRIMSGLEKKFTGSLAYAPGIERNDIRFVFQQFALLPWLSVEQNVELALLKHSADPRERKEIAQKELKRLGLERFRNAHPKELSGGMRQRVGIARALVSKPKIIFMDEPFSELDSFTADTLRKEVLDIWQAEKPTIVMVTHIVEEALELGDRIAALTPHPGKIERILSNTLPRPREKRSEPFYKLEDQLFSIIKP